MEPGKVVYLCWYDFQREREYVLTGEVTDNALYGGTMWEDWVNVKFTVPGMSAPICHHFRPERLSEQPDNVPHDEAFIACGKLKANYQQVKNNPWLEMTEFKQAHWDEAHNRLQVDALEEFYQLWAIAINWRIGYTKKYKAKSDMKMDYPITPDEAMRYAKKPSEPITQGSPAITQPYCPITPGYQKKQEVVQLSLFD